MIVYSAKNHTCYDSDLDYSALPDDLVEITKLEHQIFMGADTPDGKQLKHNCYPFEFEDIPEPTQEELEAIERNWRDGELVNYVDYFQSRPLLWDELAQSETDAVTTYRQALKDYPEVNGFGDSSLRPVRPTSPVK